MVVDESSRVLFEVIQKDTNFKIQLCNGVAWGSRYVTSITEAIPMGFLVSNESSSFGCSEQPCGSFYWDRAQGCWVIHLLNSNGDLVNVGVVRDCSDYLACVSVLWESRFLVLTH